MGSIKNKIVASDLEEERNKCNFNKDELTDILFGGREIYEEIKADLDIMESDPILRNTEKWYDFTREEMFEH
jgi:hypothetical protein